MLRGAVEHHLVVVGTGITALTLARNLLLSPLPLSITLLDKASSPGGRLSSRQYDSGTILEPGLRIFESPKHFDGTEGLFGKEVDRWAEKGWIREVGSERRKGAMGDGRWWEGAQGIKYLVGGLMAELLKLGGERLQVHYNVTVSSSYRSHSVTRLIRQYSGCEPHSNFPNLTPLPHSQSAYNPRPHLPPRPYRPLTASDRPPPDRTALHDNLHQNSHLPPPHTPSTRRTDISSTSPCEDNVDRYRVR